MLTRLSFISYQSTPQKVVQARMWAQGLTIGILIAAGALTHARRAKMYEEGSGMRHTVRLSSTAEKNQVG